MNNLNNVELIISTLDENEDFLTLKEDYNISKQSLQKITEAIIQEATDLDNMGIILQYEIWEIIIIDSIDRYTTREYNVKTGKEIHKPEIYATECVRKSIADSSPVNIPNIEYAHINNSTHTITKRKHN